LDGRGALCLQGHGLRTFGLIPISLTRRIDSQQTVSSGCSLETS
jgi:hypothetical protein